MKRGRYLFLFFIIIMLLSANLIQVNAYSAEGFYSVNELSITNVGNKRCNYTEKTVFLGGKQFGVDLKIKGLSVLGIENIETDEGTLCPGKTAGLNVGDIIISANGKETVSISELSEIIAKSENNPIILSVLSVEKKKELTIIPAKDKIENEYHLGLWCSDKTSGIGTVTYYSKEKGLFAGLGHGVTTSNRTVIPILSSTVSNCELTEIKKGTSQYPGELHGNFIGSPLGKLISNSTTGVYGIINANEIEGNEIEIGKKEDVKLGQAEIYCALDNDIPIPYEIEIQSVENDSNSVKNMIIEVTDKRLIEKTGGIVQGMSGSPIVQNNKIIGAVTHVIVENQTQGFGIFIENMLNNSPI